MNSKMLKEDIELVWATINNDYECEEAFNRIIIVLDKLEDVLYYAAGYMDRDQYSRMRTELWPELNLKEEL